MKPLLFAALAGSTIAATSARAEPLDIGAPAPAVTATDQDGKSIQLGELYQRGLVLVYFYPKAGTSGCTAQACSLRDAYEALTARGVTVVGVSTDQAADQKKFQDQNHLPFVLLADPEHKVVDAFGVPLRGATATRQAFLVKDGRIVWRDLTASTDQQAADVLAALEQLPRAAPTS